MGASLRLSPQTVQVLDALLQERKLWTHGYDISRSTGLKSGTLYPILMRLAEHKLVETCWEHSEDGKPSRHLYRLTPDGLRSARAYLLSYSKRRARQAILEGVKS
jgi:PadR family transcriptional regulator, regulatory protein PadR